MTESELNRYRKVVKARDGSVVVLRPMVPTDKGGLVALFRELPEDSRRLLKHDVTDEEVVASWADELDYTRIFPLVAQVGDEIVADATLHRYPGTSTRHVGQIRIVTGVQIQGKGLGAIILKELIELAEKVGLEQLKAEIPIGPEAARPALRSFENMGFRQEAVFKDYFKSATGAYHDVAVLFLVLKEQWKEF